MKIKSGHYWVKHQENERWVVALCFQDKYFCIPGFSDVFESQHLFKIGKYINLPKEYRNESIEN